MKSKLLITLALLAMLLTSCGSKEETKEVTLVSVEQAAGDKTIYGMVCDGCNDTIIIYLPMSFKGSYDGSNPDTLNILEASRNHQVFGQLRIGDKVAMMCNENDPEVADLVIVTEDMMGDWCYKVLPTLKRRADMEGQTDSQIMEQLPDSLQELLTVEREYGIAMKDNHVAYSIGAYRHTTTSDEEMFIEYPTVRHYQEWTIHNGKLILSELAVDSLNRQYRALSDTAEFVKLTADTLVLRFADGERGYYRKTEK